MDGGSALLTAGLRLVHASAIGARVEVEASHDALLTRWMAYRTAAEVLSHEAGPRVSPERSRGFERMAASALLLPERERFHALPRPRALGRARRKSERREIESPTRGARVNRVGRW